MFIIFSSPRSGSTLLKSILNVSKEVIIPNETNFFGLMAQIIQTVENAHEGRYIIYKLITSSDHFNFSLGKYLSKKEIFDIIFSCDYEFSAILQNIYNLLAKKNNAAVAGDKTPNDLNQVGLFNHMGLFNSDIKIIHLIRDVRDVLASLKKTGLIKDDSLFLGAAKIWETNNISLHKICMFSTNSYLLVRYEDLISNPEYTLKRICTFLKIAFSSEMLDNSKRKSDLSEFIEHNNVVKELISDRAFAWKRSSDLELLQICKSTAYKGILEFGYDLTV